MLNSWKDSVFLQREHLARMLREPMAYLAEQCSGVWGDRERMNGVLSEHFASIPYCRYLYTLDTDGLQISDNVGRRRQAKEHFGRDRSQRPYMKETMPEWGFLLSDAYVGLAGSRPSLTALQRVYEGDTWLGYLGADFDLRDLPVTSPLYSEPGVWRQIKGDPAIRGQVFQQSRVESPLDRSWKQVEAILVELLTQRGVFQCQIHFSSSQATIWTVDDPFRYRILDHEALADPDICMLFPPHDFPPDALIPQGVIERILNTMHALRLADSTIYLRTASINVFNGMVSLTFSCDGSHYMPYGEFLTKDTAFWF